MDSRQAMEQKMLGGMMTNPTGFHLVSGILRPEMFHKKSYQEIYKAMASLYAQHRPIKKELVRFALDSEMDGMETDALLSAMIHAATQEEKLFLEEYADILRENWIREESAKRLKTAAEAISKPNSDAYTILNKVRGEIDFMAGSNEMVSATSLEEAMSANLEEIARRYQGGRASGYSTGLQFIEELTGPWCPGQHIIIGAATKVGKSALAMDACLGLANYGNFLYFSFEMNSTQLASRELASRTGIGTLKQRSGKINEKEYEELDDARRNLQAAGNFKIISRKLTIEEIFDYARSYKAAHGSLAGIAVDHLGLLRPLKGGGRKDWEVAAEASPIMKEIAEELDCVAVSLSQLKKEDLYGRNFEERMKSCKRIPNADDLKGSIANDADHVIMPFREAALLSKIEPAKDTEDHLLWKERLDQVKDKGQIRLALSRESIWPKTMPVYWDGPKTRFLEMRQTHNGNELFEEGLF
jgi:replicative DNA helicase